MLLQLEHPFGLVEMILLQNSAHAQAVGRVDDRAEHKRYQEENDDRVCVAHAVHPAQRVEEALASFRNRPACGNRLVSDPTEQQHRKQRVYDQQNGYTKLHWPAPLPRLCGSRSASISQVWSRTG